MSERVAGARRAAGRPHAAVVLGPCLLAVLAACSRGDQPRLVCPAPAIIDELASFERYRPGTPPLEENLSYRAALQNITGGCTAEGADVTVGLEVDVVVEPGPAFAGSGLEVPYFVAVIDPTGEVIDRRDYVARIDTAVGVERAGSRELFSQRFVGVGPTGAAGYRILFGFALPDEEARRRAPAS